MPVYNSGAGMDMSMGGSYDQVQRPPARASRLFGSPAVSRRPSCSSWSPNNDEYAEGQVRPALPHGSQWLPRGELRLTPRGAD